MEKDAREGGGLRGFLLPFAFLNRSGLVYGCITEKIKGEKGPTKDAPPSSFALVPFVAQRKAMKNEKRKSKRKSLLVRSTLFSSITPTFPSSELPPAMPPLAASLSRGASAPSVAAEVRELAAAAWRREARRTATANWKQTKS
jgi:hypothetical protein